MNPGYRCCDCTPETCCQLWCECPEEIYVTTCKRTRTGQSFACGQGSVDCAQPDGTEIGACYEAVKLNNVKFVRTTGYVGECSNCCLYTVATGEGQTGSIEAWRDDYQLQCSEFDNGDCVRGYNTCEGYLNGPLSGSAGTWILNQFSGTLTVQCCDPTSCQGSSFKAALSISVVGTRTNAIQFADCCNQTTTTEGMLAQFFFGYQWECRHASRWVGTCPCDLMQEPGTDLTESADWGTTGCLNSALCANIGCDDVGQQADYLGPCIVDPMAITYSGTLSEGVECVVPGNNGAIESITGCT